MKKFFYILTTPFRAIAKIRLTIIVFTLCIILFFLYPFMYKQGIQKKIYEKDGVKYVKTSNEDDFYYVGNNDYIDLSYKEFNNDVTKYKIVFLNATTSSDYFYTLSEDGKTFYKVPNPQYDNFRKELLSKGVIIKPSTLLYTDNMLKNNIMTGKMLILLLGIVIFVYIIIGIARRYTICKSVMGYATSKSIIYAILSYVFGQYISKSDNEYDSSQDTNKDKKKQITFNDIVGLNEVKKDMKSLVDFIQNKEKYLEAGAKLPKGIIFYGEPGTGKTLLAKALACETNVPFIYRSGTDFIEQYVGMGAKRIRELFSEARKKAPCIVFIDEIDAIGKKRGDNDNGEDRKTINALLTEMDGFKDLDNVLIIGATNRLEDLDDALTREGRFTDKFCVPLPANAEEREDILKYYSKNKKLSSDVDLHSIAKECVGYSPAALEALLNEAAIISIQDGSTFINKKHIEKAIFKTALNGHARESVQKDRKKEELELVAWHEAGHTLIAKLIGEDVSKVTIVSSTSGAGGVTFSTPSKEHLLSTTDLKNQVIKLYGGRVAELLLYKDKTKITTGASSDIERATNIIHAIVTKYGMDEEYGLLNLSLLNIDKNEILKKEVEIAKELEKITKDMLGKNYDKLELIANSLMDKETLYSDDINKFFD